LLLSGAAESPAPADGVLEAGSLDAGAADAASGALLSWFWATFFLPLHPVDRNRKATQPTNKAAFSIIQSSKKRKRPKIRNIARRGLRS
jgi:hypothetical protein